ncbi:hypothetical protein HXX76_003404 [Chlamydomonas incerta]|nr:hypothetical protein HXX76_003404 [Chlamydomonas incerta]|eukprot:KAG2441792.1 hypothetical protein HXX76_003404 [Chlamydomonas incerta]
MVAVCAGVLAWASGCRPSCAKRQQQMAERQGMVGAKQKGLEEPDPSGDEDDEQAVGGKALVGGGGGDAAGGGRTSGSMEDDACSTPAAGEGVAGVDVEAPALAAPAPAPAQPRPIAEATESPVEAAQPADGGTAEAHQQHSAQHQADLGVLQDTACTSAEDEGDDDDADDDGMVVISGAAALLLSAPLATLLVTLAAGLTGGMLGLGGGMVMGPLLLHLGVHPQVTAATSGAMVLFSSSTALLQFAIAGQLNAQYAAVFAAASVVASLAGTLVVAGLVRRSGRPSIVVLALAGVMALGLVSVAVFGLQRAAADLGSGNIGFTDLCAA